MRDVDTAWVLCGDFNEVRESSDRLNCVFHHKRAARFNEFITNNSLIEIPITGRKFTRISDDGSKFSKLDRFLVSDKFINLWRDLSVLPLDRNTSDHCPLVFNEWFNNEEAGEVVKKAWDKPAELGGLNECDRKSWLEARRSWLGKENTKINMLKQKSRARWNLEGDENSKYFHATIKRRYNKSNIRGLNINGVWNEIPMDVKGEILAHFQEVFEEKSQNRPRMVNWLNSSGPIQNGLGSNASADPTPVMGSAGSRVSDSV
ncbi:uncharacterized protein [Rutidosis leptorrhynchoides]|uniref:uncharacterized protein n=1 Tax=Rutidosis leptorrhynchoides TaxID=125765 RepID=UPI003A99176D